jgi:hypothetical protein
MLDHKTNVIKEISTLFRRSSRIKIGRLAGLAKAAHGGSLQSASIASAKTLVLSHIAPGRAPARI